MVDRALQWLASLDTRLRPFKTSLRITIVLVIILNHQHRFRIIENTELYVGYILFLYTADPRGSLATVLEFGAVDIERFLRNIIVRSPVILLYR